MEIRRAGAIAVAAFMFTGCGTIMHGPNQNIDVQSSPSGASVSTLPATGAFTTPTVLNLERKNRYVLTFTHPGYTPASFNINHGIGGGTLLADILLGLVGVVVDGLTGSWYGLTPETATVTMTRMGAGAGPSEIRVFVTKSPEGGMTIKSDQPVSVQVTPENK